MKSIYFLVLFVFSGQCIISQNIIPRFETLGVNEGLAHSSVYSIYQDQKGFMWFGTPSGLCRYDGNSLRSFQYNGLDSSGKANNFVRGKIVEDKSGNIWYSNEDGIYKWHAITEKIELMWRPIKSKFNHSEFRTIYIDENEVLWLLNIKRGIIKYDIGTGKLAIYPLPEKIIYSNLKHLFDNVSPTGKIWLKIGDDDAPILCFDTKKEFFTTQQAYSGVNAIFFDKRKQFLVYKNKLAIYDKDKNKYKPIGLGNKKPKNSSSLRKGIKDSLGRWWFATPKNGLVCYNEKEDSFIEYQHQNFKLKSLPFDVTTCLYIDRSNNLWIGTDGGGVARLDLKRPKFNLFPLSVGDYPVLKDYFTKCFFEDDKKRIWFGTHTSGLNIYNPVTQKLINYQNKPGNKSSLPGNIVGAIFQDKDKNIWIGTNGGFSIFNDQNNTFKRIDQTAIQRYLPSESPLVYKMIQQQNGDIVCATSLGIVRITKKKNDWFVAEDFLGKQLKTFSTDILEAGNGKIYVVQPHQGLVELNKNGDKPVLITLFLKDLDIRSVSEDESNPGYLWVASAIGLIHFNPITRSYKLYNENKGLGNNHVYGVLEDSVGNLWMSTNKGLSYFNTKTSAFENYSHLNGLQSNEFNTQAFYKSASGNFYFGGVNGFNWFKPTYKNLPKLKPLSAITDIEINNKHYVKDSNYIFHRTISVPYYLNYFSFQFAALDYTKVDANKVSYFLEGWDNGAITSRTKAVRYANLPPGKYTLRMKVSNAEGTWSDEKIIHIIINAPFWKTTSFQLPIALLLLCLIIYATYTISRQRVKQKLRSLEKQIAVDAERLRISTDMHDEIGSGITRIALLSELLQLKNKETAGFNNEIKTISTSARRLVQTMSEIIWALNPQNDTLENLLAYIREQSQQYFEPFDLQFKINFPDDVPWIKLTNEERRNLYLATKELLNNAMKHSEASVISLCFCIRKNQLCFTVSDNGIGIHPRKIKEGSNGMRNLRKRIKEINGSIEWKSEKQGTEVKYAMPLKKSTTVSTFA